MSPHQVCVCWVLELDRKKATQPESKKAKKAQKLVEVCVAFFLCVVSLLCVLCCFVPTHNNTTVVFLCCCVY